MIWIIGGTTEARLAEEKLAGKRDFVITVATEGGREFVKSPHVIVGRLTEPEMEAFIRRQKITAVLDCSHPYAVEVSKNAAKAAATTNIAYLRVKRPEVEVKNAGEYFSDFGELLSRLKTLKGTFLITLGSKHIPELVQVRGENRFIFRVLPTVDSVELLHEQGVAMQDIIACLGPFSEEQNLLTIRENKVDYLVTKESGKAGGEDAKLKAAQAAGIPALILKREAETGESLEVLLQRLLTENEKSVS